MSLYKLKSIQHIYYILYYIFYIYDDYVNSTFSIILTCNNNILHR